jgi:hypothetical protein
MKTIVVLCDPERIDANLIASLRRLFPESEIKIALSGKEDVDAYPIALALKKRPV